MTKKEKSFTIDKTKRIPLIEFILFITLLVVSFTVNFTCFIEDMTYFVHVVIFADWSTTYWFHTIAPSICFLIWGGFIIRDLLMNRKSKKILVGKIVSTGYPLVFLIWSAFNDIFLIGRLIIISICFLGFC